jgi:hypothetical protein
MRQHRPARDLSFHHPAPRIVPALDRHKDPSVIVKFKLIAGRLIDISVHDNKQFAAVGIANLACTLSVSSHAFRRHL